MRIDHNDYVGQIDFKGNADMVIHNLKSVNHIWIRFLSQNRIIMQVGPWTSTDSDPCTYFQ